MSVYNTRNVRSYLLPLMRQHIKSPNKSNHATYVSCKNCSDNKERKQSSKSVAQLLTNPMSKSKSRLTTGFSLNRIFQPPPASHAPGKVSKKQDRATLPKEKLLVYVSRYQKFFEPDPNPKNCPKVL